MGKEMQSLSPADRGLKSGWRPPVLGTPSLQVVRSLVWAPTHLCGSVLQVREDALWVEALALLPLGRQPGLPGAQLAEGQMDRPMPGGQLLSHVGLNKAGGLTGNNPGEIQKPHLGCIKQP